MRRTETRRAETHGKLRHAHARFHHSAQSHRGHRPGERDGNEPRDGAGHRHLGRNRRTEPDQTERGQPNGETTQRGAAFAAAATASGQGAPYDERDSQNAQRERTGVRERPRQRGNRDHQNADDREGARDHHDRQQRHRQQLPEQSHPEAAGDITGRGLGDSGECLFGRGEHHEADDQADAEHASDREQVAGRR